MTVSTEVNHEEYTGNGVTTVFPYRFRILKAENMIVTVADISDNQTTLILNTDYTITGVGSYNGGNVVLTAPLQQDWQITLDRELPIIQETDFRNQGTFFAETHEDAFDYLTMLIQQAWASFTLALRRPNFIAKFFDAKNYKISNLADPAADQDAATKKYADTIAQTANDKIDADFKKTLRVPETSVQTLPSAANRANKLLSFDASGSPIATVPQSGSAADVLAELAKPTGAGLIGYNSTSVADALEQIAGGTVKSVDGVSPDGVGNVELNALRATIPLAIDLNTIPTNCICVADQSTLNTPTPSSQTYMVYDFSQIGGALRAQIAVQMEASREIFFRAYANSVWSAWRQLATSDWVANQLANYGLKNTALLGDTGWHKDESTGLITQWGLTPPLTGSESAPIPFTIEFPTKCIGVQLTPTALLAGTPEVLSKSVSGFTAGCNNFSTSVNSVVNFYVAIGN